MDYLLCVARRRSCGGVVIWVDLRGCAGRLWVCRRGAGHGPGCQPWIQYG